jgi:hypothetical protein
MPQEITSANVVPRQAGGANEGGVNSVGNFFSIPDVKYDVCIVLYILILNSLFNHSFLKFTYFIVRKWIQL